MRAILVSDLHIQSRAPIARAAEPDWFEAMARPLSEIRRLQESHDVPIFYAGDIFDRWNSTPETINFAIEHLPPGFAVPGQHDLPNHSYDEIKRSAYWTLVQAGIITNLYPGVAHEGPELNGMIVHGFPWGFRPGPDPHHKVGDKRLRLAIIHQFVWTSATGYPGAPAVNMAESCAKDLIGYDVAVFGDNHKGFIQRFDDGPTIVNCGGLMRRKTDEREYKPGVVLLREDGSVERHYLNTVRDKFIERSDAEEIVEKLIDVSAFVDGLRSLGANDTLDFLEALRRFVRDNKISDAVSQIIFRAAESRE